MSLKSKISLIALSVAVLLGLSLGLYTFRYFYILRTVRVPDIRQKSSRQAEDILKNEGLKMIVEGRSFDPVIPAGQVINQNPASGELLNQKEEVKVILSEGPPVGLMPEVRGGSLAEAIMALSKHGITSHRVIYAHSDTLDKDIVIAQNPGPKRKIDRQVSLIVSLGSYDVSYYCPDFRGMRMDDAQTLAEKLGLKPVLEGMWGKVTEQKPGPGTTMERGDKIRLRLDNNALN